MISLFNKLRYVIDTTNFTNILHDEVVHEFEEKFCKFVGAPYGVSLHSASAGIFLLCESLKIPAVKLPSILPPVVVNSCLNSGTSVDFIDDVEWVGNPYVFMDKNWFECKKHYRIIDSAQKVYYNQFNEEKGNNNNVIIYSFYPTKPIGSCDGGMIVSDDQNLIEEIRTRSFNGMTTSTNSWDREIKFMGWKFYMNSISAFMALQGLYNLEQKLEKIRQIRNYYNIALSLNNTSDHLYRISVKDNDRFLEYMNKCEIQCGIHYRACHEMPLYCGCVRPNASTLEKSSLTSRTTATIPMHDGMSIAQAKYVVEKINESGLLL